MQSNAEMSRVRANTVRGNEAMRRASTSEDARGVLVEIDKPSQDDTGCEENPSMAAARAEAVQF
mgnify:CR=1 FL=1